jgi:hypothetical protein
MLEDYREVYLPIHLITLTKLESLKLRIWCPLFSDFQKFIRKMPCFHQLKTLEFPCAKYNEVEKILNKRH